MSSQSTTTDYPAASQRTRLLSRALTEGAGLSLGAALGAVALLPGDVAYWVAFATIAFGAVWGGIAWRMFTSLSNVEHAGSRIGAT